jgi:hypothetical protein
MKNFVCHSEQSEESLRPSLETLRFAQGDSVCAIRGSLTQRIQGRLRLRKIRIVLQRDLKIRAHCRCRRDKPVRF